MHIQLLISTLNEGILKVGAIILPQMEDISYLISHQCTSEDVPVVPQELMRNDITIVRMEKGGLSVNRNNCLRHATGDVVVILDDDVRLKPEYIAAIRNIFSNNYVEISCCKIRTFPGEPDYKEYPEKHFQLTNLQQIKAISSIEIAFRLNSVRSKGIWFDERFGLGTSLKSGEEMLFLYECLKRGISIHYFPEYTVEHHYQSSGKLTAEYSDERLFITGAQAYALYGRFSFVRNFLAAIKRYKDYKVKGITFGHFIRVKQSGSRYLRCLRS